MRLVEFMSPPCFPPCKAPFILELELNERLTKSVISKKAGLCTYWEPSLGLIRERIENRIQWGSEWQTSSVFKWFKTVHLSNGLHYLLLVAKHELFEGKTL